MIPRAVVDAAADQVVQGLPVQPAVPRFALLSAGEEKVQLPRAEELIFVVSVVGFESEETDEVFD